MGWLGSSIWVGFGSTFQVCLLGWDCSGSNSPRQALLLVHHAGAQRPTQLHKLTEGLCVSQLCWPTSCWPRRHLDVPNISEAGGITTIHSPSCTRSSGRIQLPSTAGCAASLGSELGRPLLSQSFGSRAPLYKAIPAPRAESCTSFLMSLCTSCVPAGHCYSWSCLHVDFSTGLHSANAGAYPDPPTQEPGTEGAFGNFLLNKRLNNRSN